MDNVYNVAIEKSFPYEWHTFTTSNGIIYTITIEKGAYQEYSELCPIILENSFDIAFSGEYEDEETEDKKVYDPKVKNTICKIIIDHFNNLDKNAVLLYYCSNVGGRARNRFITFKQWYNDLMKYHNIYQDSRSFKYDSGTVYLGYLVSKGNENIEAIKAEFDSFSTLMSQGNK